LTSLGLSAIKRTIDEEWSMSIAHSFCRWSDELGVYPAGGSMTKTATTKTTTT
jgi:hypothetical protein